MREYANGQVRYDMNAKYGKRGRKGLKLWAPRAVRRSRQPIRPRGRVRPQACGVSHSLSYRARVDMLWRDVRRWRYRVPKVSDAFTKIEMHKGRHPIRFLAIDVHASLE